MKFMLQHNQMLPQAVVLKTNVIAVLWSSSFPQLYNGLQSCELCNNKTKIINSYFPKISYTSVSSHSVCLNEGKCIHKRQCCKKTLEVGTQSCHLSRYFLFHWMLHSRSVDYTRIRNRSFKTFARVPFLSHT